MSCENSRLRGTSDSIYNSSKRKFGVHESSYERFPTDFDKICHGRLQKPCPLRTNREWRAGAAMTLRFSWTMICDADPRYAQLSAYGMQFLTAVSEFAWKLCQLFYDKLRSRSTSQITNVLVHMIVNAATLDLLQICSIAGIAVFARNLYAIGGSLSCCGVCSVHGRAPWYYTISITRGSVCRAMNSNVMAEVRMVVCDEAGKSLLWVQDGIWCSEFGSSQDWSWFGVSKSERVVAVLIGQRRCWQTVGLRKWRPSVRLFSAVELRPWTKSRTRPGFLLKCQWLVLVFLNTGRCLQSIIEFWHSRNTV